MANNVEVTQGTGTVFKTTETGDVHVGHVNVDSSALPTGAATEATLDAAATDLAAIEVLLGSIDADTASIATDAAAIEALLTAMDADTSALAAAVAGSEVQVDVVASLPAGDNNIGNVDIASAIPAGDNNIGNVDLASAIPAGTNNIGDVDVLSVSGGVAANAADTATPVKVGARYDSTSPTYDNGDVTNLQADARGSLHVALRQPGADAAISGGDLANDGLSTGTIGVTSRAVGYMYNGSSVDRMRGDTTNGLDVDVTRLPALAAGTNNIGHVGGTDYETVAASQTDQMLGATGAAGDYLAGVLIIPATLSPGAVSIEDGSTNIPIFTGGSDSVLTLHPFFVPLGIKSVSGGWEITTGANVSVIAMGDFT